MSDDAKLWLNKIVHIKIDRPLGSKHPDPRFSTIYPINYGYIPGTISEADGEEVDAYVLGPTEAISEFEGKVIAVIERLDSELKLVVSDGSKYSEEQVRQLTFFQERYHQSVIIMS